MRRVFSTHNIPDYIRRIVLFSTVIITLGTGGLITVQQYVLYHRLSQQKRVDVLAKQKDFLKDLIGIEMKYISDQQKQFEEKLSRELSKSVVEAVEVADSMYLNYKDKMPEKELQKLIIRTVSTLGSSSHYSKVFINNLDGEGVFYYGNPSFSGKDLNRMTDRNGNYVIKAEVDLVREKGQGLLTYRNGALNGKSDRLNYKITFVRKFRAYNWYFGAKLYLDDYYNDFKTTIARKISSERFRYGGYVFMNELDGNPVVMDGKLFSGDFNFFDGTDSARLEVFEKQIAAAKESDGGGFFSYKWNKIGETEPVEKISYVGLYKPCNWLVGAGFYIDDIDAELTAGKDGLFKGILWNFLQVVLVLVLAVLLELYLLFNFEKNFFADFSLFTRFFKLGKGRYQRIDVDNIHFKEFREMGEVANDMIKERAKIHEQLVEEQYRAHESDRLKTAFLANMSHEIRTPMNAILGFSELIAQDDIDTETRTKFTGLILQNGEMLMTLINDIIDIAKIEAGQLSISKNWFDLNDLLAVVRHHFTEQLQFARGEHVDFLFESSLPDDFRCFTDEFRLKQVLFNLLGNAVKFTNDGFVGLWVELRETEIHFVVADSGIGISESDQRNIFERFIQAGNHLSKKFGGTGLGLAISKNIVTLLGGQIDVESELGKGAKFHFFIPFTEQTSE